MNDAGPPPLHGTQELDGSLAELRAELHRYEVALDNIAIGVCFFGPDHRLLVRNDRYAQLYGLATEQVRVGMSLAELLEARAAVGAMPDMGADAYLARTQAQGTMHDPAGIAMELRNGRSVVVRFQPLPDGGFVSTHEDITERRDAERRIAHMTHHDALTGLPNRLSLSEQLGCRLAQAPAGRPCAVLSLDLDDFKTVNDALGYQLGDAVLRATAERLAQGLPTGALLARLGADEFAIILSDGGHAAAALADGLLRGLARPLRIDGQPVALTASVGIAIAPRDGETADDLLRHADLALSAAKAGGGGRAARFSPGMEAEVLRRRALQSDLRTAMADGALSLAYQPVANVRSGHVTGFEALLRWDRPGVGRVPPAEFIPLAEENGLIVPIGGWVLREACAEAARWPRPLRVAVNVSAAQFRAPGLYEAVTGALAASGLAAARLELEITESAMMQNWGETAGLLQRLKALGVRVSMDDFGTGYSSLGNLRKFPFDKLKIDQGFVRELTANTESVAIVRAIVTLCGALGMTTTAEGVETQGQLDILTVEGCTEVQGYLLSTPRPAEEIPALLERFEAAARPVRRPAFAPAPPGAG